MSVLQEMEMRGQKRNGGAIFQFPVTSNKKKLIICDIEGTLYLSSVNISKLRHRLKTDTLKFTQFI